MVLFICLLTPISNPEVLLFVFYCNLNTQLVVMR